jgi:hydroxymethylpyrimidine/phosphomethylpyrimidine kinase
MLCTLYFVLCTHMHITDKQFATILLDAGRNTNVLVDAVITASKLLKRYGQSIHAKIYVQLIDTIAPEASVVLHAAKQANKNSAEKLRHIIKIIKTIAKTYEPTFVIQGQASSIDKIENYLTKKTQNAHIDKQEIQTNMVSISGE